MRGALFAIQVISLGKLNVEPLAMPMFLKTSEQVLPPPSG
jgi:hypothetical protein